MIVWTPRLTVVVAVIALGGCSNATAEPTTLPTVTPTVDETIAPADDAASDNAPTATQSAANVQPPVEPDKAHDYSADGVEAFTRYAIEVINYAYQTNDVSYLEQIMTPDCQTCANVVSAIRGHILEGGRVDGGQMIIHCLAAEDPATGLVPGAVIDMTVTASTTYDGSSEVVARETDRLGRFVIALSWEEDSWSLDEISFGVGEPQQECS